MLACWSSPHSTFYEGQRMFALLYISCSLYFLWCNALRGITIIYAWMSSFQCRWGIVGLICVKETVTFRSTALIFIVSPLFAYESYTLKSTSHLRNHNNVSFLIVLIPKQCQSQERLALQVAWYIQIRKVNFSTCLRLDYFKSATLDLVMCH